MQLNDRFAIEGFVNGGVYYNQVKYSNVMVVSTTQTFADNTRTTASTKRERTIRTSSTTTLATLSEISYEAEASLTGVCRLNKCWALRAGYQVLWINHLHLADAAYLGRCRSDLRTCCSTAGTPVLNAGGRSCMLTLILALPRQSFALAT